jgi:hypothetical protein
MIRTLLVVVSACAILGASVARAETWRAGVELIDQWSVFTCPVTVSGLYWDLTLEGSQLSASGPEGAKWTAQVAEGGSFKATFSGYWRGRPYEAEVRGNAEGRWVLLHNKSALCWYRLEPTAVVQAEPAQSSSEWTTVAAIAQGTCFDGALARVKEQPGSMRLTLLDGGSEFAQVDVALAADGSGHADYIGSTGVPTRVEIPPGAGKRTLRSARVDGTCRWAWVPN